jgi:hypothetical protein
MAARKLAIVVPWRDQTELGPALGALQDLNRFLLRRYPLPPLYRSGVRYKREERTASGDVREAWLTAPVAYERRVADCEDLAAWLAAEKNLAGDRGAIATAKRSTLGYHIIVVCGDGTIEDPSKMLGM